MGPPLYALDHTINDQKNLDRLCQDRPLQKKEIFLPNAFYGIDYVIKNYVGLPSSYKLKIIFPHGMRLGRTIWDTEMMSLVPMIAAYDDGYKSLLDQFNNVHKLNKIIIFSAFPYSYAPLLSEKQAQAERVGTIFFPQHSTHRITVKTDFEAVADALLKLESPFQPVTVCIYWRDYNLGHHLPFQKRGFRIVSAGHMYDPFFLFRFHHLCSMHQFASSNQIGSNLFYSVTSGCDYFFLDAARFYKLEGEASHMKSDVGAIENDLEKKMFSLFHKNNIGFSKEKTEFVAYYMGTKYLKSKEELGKLISYSERIYKERFLERLVTRFDRISKRIWEKLSFS